MVAKLKRLRPRQNFMRKQSLHFFPWESPEKTAVQNLFMIDVLLFLPFEMGPNLLLMECKKLYSETVQ
jgi:hypothetical protein